MVVKIGGIPWFNAMEVGIKKVAAELKVNAWQVGPTQADAAQQVRAVEDLIAKKVDVIAVVPNDAAALEPVFKRAHDAGIYVITHESPDQKFNDWDIELTTPDVYGETHMEAFAKALGGKGKYIIYVGSLTVPLHNKWAGLRHRAAEEEVSRDGARRRPLRRGRERRRQLQDRSRPDARPPGSGRHLDLRLAGAGRRGARHRGARQAGQGDPGRHVHADTVREILQVRHDHDGFLWNPTLAGEAIVRIGAMLASGQKIETGLEISDVGKAQVDADKRLILVPTLAAVNKDTVDDLLKMGL